MFKAVARRLPVRQLGQLLQRQLLLVSQQGARRLLTSPSTSTLVSSTIQRSVPLLLRRVSPLLQHSRRLGATRIPGGAVRRFYHNDMYYDTPIPKHHPFTPAEELMLDATAWFVAFFLCWSPEHDYDDLDYNDVNDLENQAKNRRRDSQQNHHDTIFDNGDSSDFAERKNSASSSSTSKQSKESTNGSTSAAASAAAAAAATGGDHHEKHSD